jgi:hypothetical protein
MKTFLLFLILISGMSEAADNCPNSQVDLLILGDSQTGAAWGRSYYGNFLQQCLDSKSFIIYGRGGTQPIHWLNNSGMDKIDTIIRDPFENQKNIGHANLPLCQKRLKEMMVSHQPKKVLAFFGDNLYHLNDQQIEKQFIAMIKVIKEQDIESKHCFIMTPTYEMSVLQRRNVSYKDLAASQRMNRVIKKAVGDQCQFLDGLELLKNSPYLLSSNLLKRVQSEGMSGCLGAAGNDNIHLCGEAAQDLANKVCQIFK